MESYESLVQAVVEYQENIMGSLAWSEAAKVLGVQITGRKVRILGNGKAILEAVVKRYEMLFGLASVEACKDAIRPYLSRMKVDLPKVLL
jgi:hypothetical protein